MATPNKFSNPDMPADGCLRMYAHCLIFGPLKAVFCLPCVCCAIAHKGNEKQRQMDGTSHKKEGMNGREIGEATEGQPAQQPNMEVLPDASKPTDQWPAEWHFPERNNQLKKNVKNDDAEGAKDKTVKDKLADGVLKIATAA